MSATRSASGPDERDDGTWTNESLPMQLRKELLERELSKLGFRKAAAQGGAHVHDGGAQQHGGAGASHPQADSDAGTQHAG
jgi:hypothetical protein